MSPSGRALSCPPWGGTLFRVSPCALCSAWGGMPLLKMGNRNARVSLDQVGLPFRVWLARDQPHLVLDCSSGGEEEEGVGRRCANSGRRVALAIASPITARPHSSSSPSDELPQEITSPLPMRVGESGGVSWLGVREGSSLS